MFKDPASAKTLSTIHSKYDMFLRPITTSFLSTQKHYVDCFKTELIFDLSQGHHNVQQLHHRKILLIIIYICLVVCWSFLKINEKYDIPSLYWKHKLHNCPYKQYQINSQLPNCLNYFQFKVTLLIPRFFHGSVSLFPRESVQKYTKYFNDFAKT